MNHYNYVIIYLYQTVLMDSLEWTLIMGKYIINKIKNKKATTTDGQNESMFANDSIDYNVFVHLN